MYMYIAWWCCFLVCLHLHQAVCSTSNDKAVTNLVKTLMGTDRLERIKIFAGDIVEKKKPNPDIYDLAKVRCVNDTGIIMMHIHVV